MSILLLSAGGVLVVLVVAGAVGLALLMNTGPRRD